MIKIAEASVGLSPPVGKQSGEPYPWPIGATVATTLQDCGCDGQAIGAVRGYLHTYFPGCAVRDFHERTRVTQSGLPTQHADHHVVSVTDWETAYYAVLTKEFLGRPAEPVGERLRRWDLANTLHVRRIVIVLGNGISPL